MKDPIIHHLFPTPVYCSDLERDFTPFELKFVDENKKHTYKNEGNVTSKNKYILNEKPFLNIKKELNLRIKEYFEKIYNSSNNITPYITQSWLNYTEKNQYHHKHAHPNSLVSGVMYINSDEIVQSSIEDIIYELFLCCRECQLPRIFTIELNITYYHAQIHKKILHNDLTHIIDN